VLSIGAKFNDLGYNLERLKRHSCRNEIVLRTSAQQKNFNEDKSIQLAVICRRTILVSKNVKYMQISVWLP